MECTICFNKYDEETHHPFLVIPCGHCFCMDCLNKIPTQRCPIDRKLIENKIINRGTLDVIRESTLNHSNMVLQQLTKQNKKISKII